MKSEEKKISSVAKYLDHCLIWCFLDLGPVKIVSLENSLANG